MDQRSAALLTKSQREGLLRGLGSSSSDRKLRQRINTRVQDSTVDLRLLFSRLEEEELEDVFRSDLSAFEEYLERLEDTRMGIQEYSRRTRSTPSDIYDIAQLLEKYTDTIDELQSLEADLNELSGGVQEESQVTFDQQEIEDQVLELEDEAEFLRDDLLEVSQKSKEELENWKYEIEKVTEHLQTIVSSSDELRLFLDEDYSHFIESVERALADHEELEEELGSLIESLEELERVLESEDYPRRGITREEIDFVEKADRLDDLLDSLLENYGRRARHRHDSEPHLYEAMDILRHHLRGQVFSPDMRDNVVKSIGFYLRVSDAVGADLENMIEEAIESMIATHRQNEVLDSASVNINTESKDSAIQRGEEKIGKYRLSNAELRALVGRDRVDVDGLASINSYSLKDQLLERVLEEPSILGSEIEFTEIEPTIEYHGMPVRTDLMGKDLEGNTGLIDIEVDFSENLTAELERMQLLIDAVDGEDEVRGIIIVPKRELEDEKPLKEEFPRVDICPIKQSSHISDQQ